MSTSERVREVMKAAEGVIDVAKWMEVGLYVVGIEGDGKIWAIGDSDASLQTEDGIARIEFSDLGVGEILHRLSRSVLSSEETESHDDATDRYVVRHSDESTDLERELWGDRWHLVDTESGEVVAGDDWAPEDATLARDAGDLVWLLNELAAENAELRRRIEEADDE